MQPSRTPLNGTYPVFRQTFYAFWDELVVLRSLIIQQQGFEHDITCVEPDL